VTEYEKSSRNRRVYVHFSLRIETVSDLESLRSLNKFRDPIIRFSDSHDCEREIQINTASSIIVRKRWREVVAYELKEPYNVDLQHRKQHRRSSSKQSSCSHRASEYSDLLNETINIPIVISLGVSNERATRKKKLLTLCTQVGLNPLSILVTSFVNVLTSFITSYETDRFDPRFFANEFDGGYSSVHY